MAEPKTNRRDVVATFHRYIGKNPTTPEDWATVEYLMTKPPQEVEARLAKSAEEIRARAGDTGGSTTTIDPLKIAQSLGYTEADFANDPNFVNYWKNKSKAELEEALTDRGDFSQELGRKRTPREQEDYSQNEGWLDDLLRSGEIDQIKYNALKDIMTSDSYTTGQNVPTEEELQKMSRESIEKARTELKPYYERAEGREMEDLKDYYSDARNKALRYQQQEGKSYAEKLADTKKDLRVRGLIFSGRSRAVLGKEGALADKGIEGEVPQQRRYDWEDVRAGWQEDLRDTGIAAERKYGSAKLHEQRDFLNPEGLPDPYAEGVDYQAGRVSPLYLPKRDATQRGFVSRNQADIEIEKEYEAQKRAEDRKKTNQYY